MPDMNGESLAVWNALKPMIDEEIKCQTRGMVQRRKAIVTTAPSLVSGLIGVTEPFGYEIMIPFVSNLSAAKVGDSVWVEFMYGATNAFASMFASADTKDVTVGGVLDVIPRRCAATLTSAGWYRVMRYTAANQNLALGMVGAVIDFTLTRQRTSSGEDNHSIKMMMVKDDVVFRDEVSHSLSGYQRFTKIRYTNSGNVGYVDIYYSGGTSYAEVDFVVHTRPAIQDSFVAESLQAVDAAPTGETVLTEYSFSPDTRAYEVATKDSNFDSSVFTLTATRRGDFIVYYFNIRVPALAAATETTMGTFSTLKPPSGFNLTTCGQSGGAFLIQFKTSGDVTIYATNATTQQFVRGSMVIPTA